MSTRFKYYQPNKKDIENEYGDCVIRALTKATGKDWLTVFEELIPYARECQAMLNSKVVYGKYLEDNGFKWVGIKVKKGYKKPTPQTFYRECPKGTYILRLSHHVVTVVDGYFYDTWDSGNKSVYGYWTREEV